jgi:hypothetical protein
MANTVYPLAKEGFMSEDIDLLVDTISIQMFADDSVYDATDEFLSDVTGTQVGSPVTITSKDVTDGQFTSTTPSLLFTPPGGFTVTTLVIYVNTGSDATSRVLSWIDTKGDTTPISMVTTGDSINLHWDDPFLSIGG